MTKCHAVETQRTAQATDHTEPASNPKTGDAYHCDVCGMALEITADCHCQDHEAVRLQCCGQEMARV